MRAVGYRGPDIFRGGAYRRMAKASEGLTRRINILADKALLAAFAEDTFDVGKRHVGIAINDSQFVRARRWGMPEISLVFGLVLIVAAVAWTFAQRSDIFVGGLRNLLPGGAADGVSQPATNAPPASVDSVAAATPQRPQAAAEEPAAVQIMSPAPTADPDPSAAPAGAALPSAGEQQSGSSEQYPAPLVVPIAEGGSQLMLSDTLSTPSRTDSLREPSPAAPDGAEAAADDAPQAPPAVAAPMVDRVVVTASGAAGDEPAGAAHRGAPDGDPKLAGNRGQSAFQYPTAAYGFRPQGQSGDLSARAPGGRRGR